MQTFECLCVNSPDISRANSTADLVDSVHMFSAAAEPHDTGVQTDGTACSSAITVH